MEKKKRETERQRHREKKKGREIKKIEKCFQALQQNNIRQKGFLSEAKNL